MTDAASLILRERGSSMKDLQEKFEKIGVIPVIVIDEAKNAEPLAEALVAGGLPCAEITFRTPGCGRKYPHYDAKVSRYDGWSWDCFKCRTG